MNIEFFGTGFLSAGFVRSARLGLTGVLTLALTACATEPSSDDQGRATLAIDGLN